MYMEKLFPRFVTKATEAKLKSKLVVYGNQLITINTWLEMVITPA